MKNTFKTSSSNDGATCGLCQDTLLRHISQSRVFWYCPSCRQEMVCEGPETASKLSLASRIGHVSQQRKLAKKVTDHHKQVSVQAS